MKNCVALLISLLFFSLSGCGGPSPVAAGGTITYQGKPVPSASVSFVPTGESSDKRMIATGETDAEGKFAVGTVKPGDGAAPGDYTVTVRPKGPEATAGNYDLPATKPPFPVSYGDPLVSSLKVTVKSGDPNQFTLELKD